MSVGNRIVVIALATAACADGGDAGAMTRTTGEHWCQVSGADKLPPEIGGADGLCAEIARALQPVAAKPAAVAVTVVSPYLASAEVTLANGRKLSAVKVGSSDRTLGDSSMKMFARTIAKRVAAGK